jgi:hypothetical protein
MVRACWKQASTWAVSGTACSGSLMVEVEEQHPEEETPAEEAEQAAIYYGPIEGRRVTGRAPAFGHICENFRSTTLLSHAR